VRAKEGRRTGDGSRCGSEKQGHKAVSLLGGTGGKRASCEVKSLLYADAQSWRASLTHLQGENKKDT